jgi:hypothetical protein
MVEVGKQKSRCEHGRVFGWEWASFLESFEVNDEPCEMKRGNVEDKIESKKTKLKGGVDQQHSKQKEKAQATTISRPRMHRKKKAISRSGSRSRTAKKKNTSKTTKEV